MKKTLLFLFFLSLLFVGKIYTDKQETYTLSICAIFKDEAPYLKEWIEYHKLVGVEHFYLYNNGSEDNYREVLAPYIKAKEVSLVDWPNKNSESDEKIWAWVYNTQTTAYEHAFKTAKGKSKWVAAIDIDEFIVPAKADTITQVLEKYEKEVSGIQIFWRVYGTSDIDEIPSDRLLIETLNKKSFANVVLNKSYKTILKPDQYQGFAWPPHRCSYLDGKEAHMTDPSEIVINHYLNRSNNYFYSTKIKKKELMDNVKYSVQEIAEMAKIGNDLVDTDPLIHRFVPALREKMDLQPAIAQVKSKLVNIICDFHIEDLSLSPALYKDSHINLRVKPLIRDVRDVPGLNQDAEKIVVFNQLIHPAILSKIPREKLLFFLWEPWEIPQRQYDCYSRVYTWNDDLVDNVKFFKVYAPNLMPMEEKLPTFEEKKFCVMVAGSDVDPAGRANDLYSERLRMVEFFETKPKGKLEIYGRNWTKRAYRDYISPIPGAHSGKQKISVLKNYRFNICFENTKNINGYITEKIFDSFAAGCVPIYWGASNIEKYIPKNCFVDYRDFGSRQELYTFLHQISKEKYEEYITHIRAFLKSEKGELFSTSHFQKIFYEAIAK